ncbi:MAG: PSD1 and planctomycete cytochrome C domain-containing protein [Pirellulales bacterium]
MASRRRTIRTVSLAWLLAGAAPLGGWQPAPAAEPAKVDFATAVQPIFAAHCYQCHGPDEQESGLRFDLRDRALKGGDSGPWFVAGKSSESEIVRRITAEDETERMPPPDEPTRPLSAAQIETIKAWIDSGAVWPEPQGTSSNHWAFQRIERPTPPAVKNEAWVRNPIDRFVLARLDERGIAPSPEADRYTLIKRLSYDLVGLPPCIEEVDAFVRDPAPDAYERLVEGLLDSPRYGERWGRHWLDKARYADSDGYEKDNARPDAWRYRDWVIDAVNADMPLDEFTIEQLAGDLLPGFTSTQQLATAFHRQTLTNTEGGTDQEEFRVAAIFDRVATTGTVWLGLTVGCAQCHSHKYDPITQKEYYQLFAFFNNGDETTTNVPLVGDPLAQWRKEKEEAERKLVESRTKLEKMRVDLVAKIPAWEAEIRSSESRPIEFHPVELVSVKSSAGAELKLLSDGSYLAGGKNPDVDKVTITAKSDLKQIAGFRIEAIGHESLGGRGPGRTDQGNFVLGEIRAFAAPTEEFKSDYRLKLKYAEADYNQDGFPAADAIDGEEKTGWAVGGQTGRDHWVTIFAEQTIETTSTPWLELVLSQNYGGRHTLGRFRVMAVTGNDPLLGIPQNVRDVLAVPVEKRSPEQTAALADFYVGGVKEARDLVAEIKKLENRVAAEPVMNVRVIGQRIGDPRSSHVLARGDFLDPKDEVQPGALAVLSPFKPRGSGTPDRLDLARWLVDPANPLARRVLVNQLWSHLFGRGIVRTMNDFGARGEPPTHPELLDWLASELAERRWSRKDMIRLVVSSATYRQASVNRPELAEVDPTNDLFHRQSRYRVEAEIVRDLALSAAGLLSDKIGGPSVFPPMPADIAALSYANNFKWNESTGEDRYRRGMYTFFKRTAPHPNLTTFDCPDSNTTCIERRASNTPLQALTTLNNDTFVEASRAMARRTLAAKVANDDERLTLALRWCIARPPTGGELAAFGELLSESRQWYVENASQAPEVIGPYKLDGVGAEEAAAWVAAVRMVMNLDEFLTRE